ncbi:MAG TPA: hypothetical protein VF458_07530 [Ktedonobacteraceae bacterium]
MQRELYPDNWEEIALAAKIAANWTCQRCGVCRGDRQINRYGRLVKVVLTTAHLNHDPWNSDAELEVMCWPCHAKYDAAHRRNQRTMMLIARGQLVLPGLHDLYKPPRVRNQQPNRRPQRKAPFCRRRENGRARKEVKALKA